jgi:Ras-related protein Rab-11A
MAEIEVDIIYKIILVGDTGVGKTKILTRYTKDEFSFDSKTTLGVEFGSKIYNINDNIIKLQIWDTAGQERYRSITCAYYKGSAGAIIVFDVARKETFENVDRWHEDIMRCADKDICIILIGNKCDLEIREVKYQEATEKAKLLSKFFNINFF